MLMLMDAELNYTLLHSWIFGFCAHGSASLDSWTRGPSKDGSIVFFNFWILGVCMLTDQQVFLQLTVYYMVLSLGKQFKL